MSSAKPNYVYLNGQIMPIEEAKIPVLDRGFLFGDAIYEVIPAYNGTLFRLASHLERLADGLSKISIDNPFDDTQWEQLVNKLLAANGSGDATIYLQVTRGAASERDHAFPKESVTPLVFGMYQPLNPRSPQQLRDGMHLELAEDTRWSRCDIKSTSLLANVLHRQAATEFGLRELVLHRDGIVTEGAASTIMIFKDNVLLTPPNSHRVLPGTTRRLILELAQDCSVDTEARVFSVDELVNADEVMLSSVSNEIMPVCRVGSNLIGSGKPGPVWQQLDQAYQEYKHRLCHNHAEDAKV